MNRTHILVALSCAGLIFSGYYAGAKLLTNTCAFGETCPLFLGYPACYFGFTMFLVLTVASVVMYVSQSARAQAVQVVRAVALLGVLFAGYFTLRELPVLFAEGLGAYFFGLPTCAIGLLFYMGILYASARMPVE